MANVKNIPTVNKQIVNRALEEEKGYNPNSRDVKKFLEQRKILRETQKKMRQKEFLQRFKKQVPKINKYSDEMTSRAGTLVSKGVLGRESKASMRTQKDVSKAALGIARAFVPAIKSGGAKVGRPSGPSGKYYIPGKGPVGVYEYRRYLSYQNRLQALQGTNAQSSPEQMMQQLQQQQMQQQVQSYPQQVQQMPIQQFQSQPTMGFGTVTRDPGVNLADDSFNILKAPSFMKGEMIKTSNAEVPIIKMGARPVTNSFGNEYMDIDPASGRPMLRRRISEKWLTGEAL